MLGKTNCLLINVDIRQVNKLQKIMKWVILGHCFRAQKLSFQLYIKARLEQSIISRPNGTLHGFVSTLSKLSGVFCKKYQNMALIALIDFLPFVNSSLREPKRL